MTEQRVEYKVEISGWVLARGADEADAAQLVKAWLIDHVTLPPEMAPEITVTITKIEEA